jgi:hypothetical protein
MKGRTLDKTEYAMRRRPGMSALGQKQTSAAQKGMSALPLKADIGAAQIDVR